MSEIENNLPCDVVILPSKELAEKAIAASKLLEPYGSLFTLEIGKYIPHASLYMLQLKETDLERVQEVLAGVAAEFDALSLNAERFYQAERFVDVEYGKNEQLVKLQKRVIAALNPMRDGMREKDKARMLKATGLALVNFEQYGYKPVGELFRPHITFTRLSEDKADAEMVLPALNGFEGTFTRIGLFEMGDNGTCVRQIATWGLK